MPAGVRIVRFMKMTDWRRHDVICLSAASSASCSCSFILSLIVILNTRAGAWSNFAQPFGSILIFNITFLISLL